MQRETKLIYDKEELTGTDYFEFLPGKYHDQCWCDGSVFLDEETFTLLEPAFAMNIRHYDHYAFTEVSKDEWPGVLSALRELGDHLNIATQTNDLEGRLGMMFTTTESDFNQNFEINKNKLIDVADRLRVWIMEALAQNECVTILGM